MTVEAEGLPEMLKSLRGMGQMSLSAVRGVLVAGAERVVARAKELAPRYYPDGGALPDTIHATPVQEGPTGISIEILAGGPEAPWAEEVHEDMTMSHHHGVPKYLERAAMAEAPAITDELKKLAG